MTEKIHWSRVTLQGPDSADFLHRLTTVNIKTLAPGSRVPGCFLSAQGKIRAAFWLERLAVDSFAFEFDAGPEAKGVDTLHAIIEEYRFSEKFDVSPAVPGVLLHSVFGDVDATARVEKLIAWWGHEITDQVLPVEIGWGKAVAENKGCYPGQEVIEKIISLGSPPRRLVRIEGEGTPPPLGPCDGGTITTSVAIPQGFAALALLRKTHAQAGKEIAGGKITQVADA